MTAGVVRGLVAALALTVVVRVDAGAEPTGRALGGLEAFDQAMTALLKKWGVPGAGLAVARGDRLLLVRGYGLANRERSLPVEPTSVFRLASLSKTITAVAVLQLVQDNRLGLDDRVVPILGEIGPRPDRIADPRVDQITVRHLLQHTGGFNRARSGDVMFMPGALAAARRHDGPLPPDCPTIMRDTLERWLDFTPGEHSAYSNVGYCILGRVIERVSGMPYEAFVRGRILDPVGATSMKVGRTREPAEHEVTYYDSDPRQTPAMPGLGLKRGPRPYGEFAVETMDSYGGWIGTPVDYLRFILAIDGWRGTRLLTKEAVAQMNSPAGRTAIEDSGDDFGAKGVSYGLGIYVRPVPSGLNLWHSGSLPATNTLAIRTADGFAWVVAFNSRPRDRRAFRADFERRLWNAKSQVQTWPDGDLFAPLADK